ncbi:MAG: DUF169 domain-containing protein [Thermodesulfobacteriota bacterium]|jgi:uncharacterized protein (DUF169 family)
MDKKITEGMRAFFEQLGLPEEPFGMFYTDQQPGKGYSPKPGNLPTAEMEKKGEVNWGSVFENFSCVIGNIWRARRMGTPAYFDRERFGCLGGAFYLGFLKPQLDFIAYYISTGIPNQIQGEHYLESPEITRHFFQTVDPRPAPARYCIFKPISQFALNEQPELIIFFSRGEILCGLNQLATFVTNDFEAVCSPFGAGCTSLVTWPLRYLAQGKLKAVLGGWDPSDRKFLKPDELTFTVPLEMFERMVLRWRESFLKTPTWKIVQKKIDRSRRIWGE